MKLRTIAIIGGMIFAATVSAQTLTDVINAFNAGVEKVNNQEYDASIEHFNETLTLAEAVGAEADEMKGKAEAMITKSYYGQATMFLKRKQYDNAIPYLENTIKYGTEYDNNADQVGKAKRYLMQSYMREGQRNFKAQTYDEAINMYDKALEMNGNLYQAHMGKGMVYYAQDEADMMMEEFALAKAGAEAKGDQKTLDNVDSKINDYYNRFILEEVSAIDPEEPDYEYVIETCENALAANPNNPRALYFLAMVSNKQVEYDTAIEYALKALEYETDPMWVSGINLELGSAYQNTVEYDKACEAYKKVTEDPYLTRAEKRMGNLDGCN